MGGILVYALHDDEGNFNKNSLGALSEAAKLAGEIGTEASAVVVGERRIRCSSIKRTMAAAQKYRRSPSSRGSESRGTAPAGRDHAAS